MIRALFDYIRLQRHKNRYDKEKITAYQFKALKRLVRLAKEESPYYQKTLSGLPFDTLDDFKGFPTINKSLLMEHFSEINTHGLHKEDCERDALRREHDKDYLGYYQDKYVIGLSSGTSGNKGIFITSKSLTKRLPAVFLARGGVKLKDLPLRILFMLRVFSQGFADINAPFVKLNYLSTMADPQEVIAKMNTMKTNVLMAPPSMIRFLLPLAKDLKRPLKRIITYAEVLTKEDKDRIATTFQTDVVEIYQASEGQIASPCAHGHLHINEDLVYVELYDDFGNPVTTPHVIGTKMIVTNLVNEVQPLIRYEMNDMIVLDDPCPCGSSFRRIEKIIGRHDDILYVWGRDNQPHPVFPDLFARWIITESTDIREFQVIQHHIGIIEITIDAPPSFDPKCLQQRVEKELIEFDYHATLLITTSQLTLPADRNKYKRFISHINHPDVNKHR